jgi:hypothetical protein
LGYYFTCGRPARKQPLYDKNDDKEVLKLRFGFIDYLRKNHYSVKDIYFCGLRMYSFEVKGNYLWVPENYSGNILEDYGDQKYKSNEAICLVTMSYNGIIKTDIIIKDLEENFIIQHIREGYLKYIA